MPALRRTGNTSTLLRRARCMLNPIRLCPFVADAIAQPPTGALAALPCLRKACNVKGKVLPTCRILSACAQVLCCEVEAVFATLVGSEELMGKLFSLLKRPKPLDCMLAGYFTRVITALLMRRHKELLAHIQVRGRVGRGT